MKILILSNDTKFVSLLDRTLQEYMFRKFVSVEVARAVRIRDYLASDEDYDVVIVDDDFEKRTCIETARLVRTKDPKVAIIIISNSPDRVYDSFSVRAHRFLVKPLTQSSMYEALDAYRKDIIAYRLIIVKTSTGYQSISSEDIVYVEAAAKYSILHLQKGGELRTGTSFAQLLIQLPEEYFFRTHRSYIVNMLHISALDAEHITLRDGTRLPVSRRRKVNFFMEFSKFASGHTFI